MQTASDYLEKTESAVHKLFEGIDSYTKILKSAPPPHFLDTVNIDNDYKQVIQDWAKENEIHFETSRIAQEKFIAENFALATLCGAVLEVAAKALELYSKNEKVPAEWSELIKESSKQARFVIGKSIRNVPLGLIIYAARNQYMHFEEGDKLKDPINLTVFKRLASFDDELFLNEKRTIQPPRLYDPAFDLSNQKLLSFSHNVTALIRWRSYDAYKKDMHKLLNIS